MTDEFDSEGLAADVLRDVLHPDDVVPRDVPGAPPGTHDFDLIVDGRRLSVEVTTSTDERLKGFWAAIEAHDWFDAALTGSWSVIMSDHARVRDFHKRYRPLLNELDRLGIEKLDNVTPVPKVWGEQAGAAIRALLSAGATTALRNELEPHRVVISTIGPGNWSSAEDLNEAVISEFEPNIEKLRNADGDERHLFVWLDAINYRVQAAVSFILTTRRPPPPIALPEGIDVVWAAPIALVRGGSLLLRGTAGGWEIVISPD